MISRRMSDDDSSGSEGDVEVIESPQKKLKFTLNYPEKDKIDVLTQVVMVKMVHLKNVHLSSAKDGNRSIIC